MLPVTVVIPTYNGAAFIGEALASVFAQTLPPAEVIVVDDCSTDGTANLVQALAHTVPVPLRLIRCDRNSGGPAHPLNVGVAAAQGELIAVLDQDDVFAPDKIEREVGLLTGFPDAALVAGFCAAWGAPDQVRSIQLDVFRELGGPDSMEAVEFPGKQILPSLLLKGQVLPRLSGFYVPEGTVAGQGRGGGAFSRRVRLRPSLLAMHPGISRHRSGRPLRPPRTRNKCLQ